MNIIDFLIISCVFVILSYLPEDNIYLFLVKPITMVCFVLFYYKKVSLIKKEHFIKCYSGHEPAHPNDSYNNPLYLNPILNFCCDLKRYVIL